MKDLVIITLNYNQNDYTIKCIKSLLEADYLKCYIVLIDNGSTEQNYSLLKENLPKDERILLKRIDKNIGYVGGINYGLKEGTKLNPSYFLIMNNDTIIDKYAIEELIKTCKEYNNKAIVTGKVYNYNEPNRLQYIGSKLINKKYLEFEWIGKNEIDNGQFDQVSERDLIDDIFWLIPQELYKILGGYSNYFWFNGESSDYALNAKKLDYKLIYTPNAKLWHKGSVSIGGRSENPRMVYWITQSVLIFKYLHLNKINFTYFYIIYFSERVVFGFLKIFLKLLTGKKINFKIVKASIQGFIYFNKWVRTKTANTGKEPF